MKNLTYLLGAGASYYCLPLQTNFVDRLKLYRGYIKYQISKGKINHLKQAELYLKSLSEIIIQLEKGASITIDNFAKRLSLSPPGINGVELHHVKQIVSDFLIYEQSEKTFDDIFGAWCEENNYIKVESLSKGDREMLEFSLKDTDGRYEAFLNIFYNHNNLTIPKNINIISWNYDVQIEIHHCKYKGVGLKLAQQDLQVHPSPNVNVYDPNRSAIVKMNGSSGLSYDISMKKLQNGFDKLNQGELCETLDHNFLVFKTNYNRIHTKYLVNYAWDNDEHSKQTREVAKKILSNTEYLVVVGYSFDLMNKDIDKEIFSSASNLKRIYVNIPEDKKGIDKVKEGLFGINPQFEKLTDFKHDITGNFYYPTVNMG